MPDKTHGRRHGGKSDKMTALELIALLSIILAVASLAALVLTLATLEPSTEWAEVLNTSITTLNGVIP